MAKTRTTKLTREMTLPDAAVALFGEQVARMRAHAPGAIKGEDPEDLHDLRVATRRSRALLRMLRPYAAGEALKIVRRELSWLGDLLGDVRDLDVFEENLGEQLEQVAATEESGSALRAATEAMRVPCHTRMMKALRSARCRRLLEGLEDELTIRMPLQAHAEDRAREIGRVIIERDLGDVLKRSAKGVETLPDTQLHKLRIAFKRIRYACEFFRDLYGSGMKKAIKEATRYQDALGRLQDANEAQRILECLVERVAGAGRGTVPVLLTAGALLQVQREKAAREREEFYTAWERFPTLEGRIERALDS